VRNIAKTLKIFNYIIENSKKKVYTINIRILSTVFCGYFFFVYFKVFIREKIV